MVQAFFNIRLVFLLSLQTKYLWVLNCCVQSRTGCSRRQSNPWNPRKVKMDLRSYFRKLGGCFNASLLLSSRASFQAKILCCASRCLSLLKIESRFIPLCFRSCTGASAGYRCLFTSPRCCACVTLRWKHFLFKRVNGLWPRCYSCVSCVCVIPLRRDNSCVN